MNDLEVTRHNITFRNRNEELTEVFRSNSSLLVIDAPAGYGKTFLLDAIERRALSEHKYQDVARLTLSVKQTAADVANEVIRQLSKTATIDAASSGDSQEFGLILKKYESALVIFDEAEQIYHEVIEWLLEALRVRLSPHPFDSSFRMIFAGRYLRVGENQHIWAAAKEIPPLSGFTDEIVTEQLMDRITRTDPNLKLTHEELRGFAQAITFISGGHPDSIDCLISHVTQDRFTEDYQSQNTWRTWYSSCVQNRYQEIIYSSGLDELATHAFEILAVFRFFSADTIYQLKARGYVSSEISPNRFIQSLGSLVRHLDTGIYSDQIIRNLARVKLVLVSPEQYSDLNRVAQEIYDSWLDGFLKQSPPAVYDLHSLSVKLAVESVYHSIQQQLWNSKSAASEVGNHILELQTKLIMISTQNGGSHDVLDLFEFILRKDDDIRAHIEEIKFEPVAPAE